MRVVPTDVIVDEMGSAYETGDLYQIGMPAWCLSTVFALWTSYERPGKMMIYPAKTDEWAVVELRDTRLAASIVESIGEARLHKEYKTVKHVTL